jgi:hypothetical protein
MSILVERRALRSLPVRGWSPALEEEEEELVER